MARDIFDEIAASTPLNSTAGMVTSKGEQAWKPRKPVPHGHLHWDAPPPMQRFSEIVGSHETTPNLTGIKFGRFTVVGILADGIKTNRGMRWVVRCVCGDYEARSTSAIKLATVTADHEKQTGYQCFYCTQLGVIQRDYKKKGSKPLSHFTTQNGKSAPQKHSNPLSVIADEIFTNSDQWDMDDMGMGAATQIVARLNAAGYRVVRDTVAPLGQPVDAMTRPITGPIVIEPKTQPDGSIKYEVWDNGAFSFHCIDTFDTRAKAEAAVKKLRQQ